MIQINRIRVRRHGGRASVFLLPWKECFICSDILLVWHIPLKLLAAQASFRFAAFYGPVLMLAAHDGKMVVWLPWTDTKVTQSLAGFPDVSTLEFTGWCIALRKVMISAS